MVRDKTVVIRGKGKDVLSAREVLLEINGALTEQGYNPVSQIAGYLASGEPCYITGHKNARNLIRRLERLEILEELVRYYLDGNSAK
ncbi:MAG: IreB family regulatory phosphoprotein [Chloroflexota bacterium]